MQIIVLIDYDNVKFQRRERSLGDVQFNLDRLIKSVSELRAHSLQEYRDVRVRLYGGWTDIDGTLLQSAAWLTSATSTVRGSRLGGRITAELAFGLFDCKYNLLRGLYRDGGQKMVDTLLVADAMRITLAYDAKVVIVSDDEDMLPGLLGCHVHQPSALVKRHAEYDSWHNKSLVTGSGIISYWGSL